jgi:membrane protein YqaA with SNARE-associated domain
LEPKIEKKKKFWSAGVWVGLIGVTIAVCVVLIRFWRYLNQFQILIYVGLFFTAVLAGSPLPIPTPCFALTFTLGSRFDPFLIGMIAATGAAIGGMLVYYTARTGKHFMPNINFTDPANKIYSNAIGRFLRRIKLPRFMEIINRRGPIGVFLFSMFPNPFLMPLLITMGINKVAAWKIAVTVWAGDIIMYVVIAAVGHYGLGSILRLFQGFKLP